MSEAKESFLSNINTTQNIVDVDANININNSISLASDCPYRFQCANVPHLLSRDECDVNDMVL